VGRRCNSSNSFLPQVAHLRSSETDTGLGCVVFGTVYLTAWLLHQGGASEIKSARSYSRKLCSVGSSISAAVRLLTIAQIALIIQANSLGEVLVYFRQNLNIVQGCQLSPKACCRTYLTNIIVHLYYRTSVLNLSQIVV
jgi:hypothetical protein